MNNSRLLWPDYVKALAIWMVVFCHANVSVKWVYDFIVMFHMPVFFIISGFFDKGKFLSWQLLRKYISQLLIPYFFFNVLALTVCWVSPYLHPELYPGQQTFYEIYRSAIIGIFLFEDKVTMYSMLPCLPLWFLPALFFIKLAFAGVINLSNLLKRNVLWTLIVVSFFLMLCGFLLPNSFNFFSFHSSLLSFPFYLFGYIFREKLMNTVSLRNNVVIKLLVLLCCLTCLYYFGLPNGSISIDECYFGNSFIFFYLNGIIGFYCCYLFASLFSSKFDYFQEIGQSTISILGTHLYFCIIGKSIAVVFGYDASFFPLWVPALIASISCIAGVAIHRFFLKKCPAVIGRRKV